jgi:hypothetical protein
MPLKSCYYLALLHDRWRKHEAYSTRMPQFSSPFPPFTTFHLFVPHLVRFRLVLECNIIRISRFHWHLLNQILRLLQQTRNERACALLLSFTTIVRCELRDVRWNLRRDVAILFIVPLKDASHVWFNTMLGTATTMLLALLLAMLGKDEDDGNIELAVSLAIISSKTWKGSSKERYKEKESAIKKEKANGLNKCLRVRGNTERKDKDKETRTMHSTNDSSYPPPPFLQRMLSSFAPPAAALYFIHFTWRHG